MAEIEQLCLDVAEKIRQISPDRWAQAYFQGSRCNHFSSNVQEFHRCLNESQELPILQLVGRVHAKITSLFKERRERGLALKSVLVPSAERRVSDVLEPARAFNVLRSDESEFEVLSPHERSEIMNITDRTCSCGGWQLHRIPCTHAVSALISCNRNIYGYIEPYFTAKIYREMYSVELRHLPDRSEWANINNNCNSNNNANNLNNVEIVEMDRVVRPPKCRRVLGRPEKRGICLEDSGREKKHAVHSSRCNRTGHYKRTCKVDFAPTMKS